MLDYWSHLSANVPLLVIKGYLSNSKIPYLPVRKLKNVHLRIVVSDPDNVLRIYSSGVCYVNPEHVPKSGLGLLVKSRHVGDGAFSQHLAVRKIVETYCSIVHKIIVVIDGLAQW